VIAALVLTLTVAAAGPPDEMRAWSLQGSADRTDAAYRIDYRRHEAHGDSEFSDEHTVSLATRSTAFAGLTLDALYGPGTHVHFENRRDAGTIVADGWAANGSASGTFTVTPSEAFARDLERRGIGSPNAAERERLVYENATYAMLDELGRFHLPAPTLDQLMRMLDHGVDGSYLAAMRDAGFAPKSLDELIAARDHGVDAAYVRALRAEGIDGSLDDFIRARDHGVRANDASGFAKLGYARLSIDDLVRMRDHGVTEAWVTRLRDRGYAHLSVDDLVRMRDHGL
jgi:hypothetical protein